MDLAALQLQAMTELRMMMQELPCYRWRKRGYIRK